jgi:hypothetical protein
MIKSGKWYSCDVSDLKVYIVTIQYENNEYYKVRYNLFNKKNGTCYELRSKAKLYKKNIRHWYEL